jgi:hypothetical protein
MPQDTQEPGGKPVMHTLYIAMDIHKNFIQAAAMDKAVTNIS